MKPILAILIAFVATTSFAKDIKYVCSENGLDVKSTPNANAKTIDIADYATEVTILNSAETTDFVKVQFYRNMTYIEGYVYADELTDDKLQKRVKIQFEDATVYIKDVQLNGKLSFINAEDNITLDVFGDNVPFEKTISVEASENVSVKIYQQTEKGFVFYSNNNFCKLDDWKTFKSDWQELPPLLDVNSFSALGDTDFLDYKTISVAEVKAAIAKHCQASLANSIQPFKTLKENEMGLQTKKVRYKIELTDTENNITEKIIEFNITIGC